MTTSEQTFNFSASAYWEARQRQGNRCASCRDDLGDASRTEAPGHHAGITRQEAKALGMNEHPEWVRSSENCAVICASCHTEFAHDGGQFRTAVESSGDYISFEDDIRSSRLLSEKQEVAYQNAESAFYANGIESSTIYRGIINMPGFDDRSKDQTRDNLFGADAGPKAEQGPAKLAGGGQGDNSAPKNEQSLDQSSFPQGNWREETQKTLATNAEQKSLSRWEFPENQQSKESTSYTDFINSTEAKDKQKNEQAEQQKQEEIKKQEYEHKY